MDAFSQGFVKSAGLLRMGMKALPYAAGGAGALWAGSQISPEFGKAVGQLGSDIRKKYLDTVYPLTQSDGPKPLAEGPTLTAADRLGPRPLAQGPTNEAAAALPKPTASGPTLEAAKGLPPVEKAKKIVGNLKKQAPAPTTGNLRSPGPQPASDVYNTADIKAHLQSQPAQNREAVLARQQQTGRQPSMVARAAGYRPANDMENLGLKGSYDAQEWAGMSHEQQQELMQRARSNGYHVNQNPATGQTHVVYFGD